MKLGLLPTGILAREVDPLDTIRWAADNGAHPQVVRVQGRTSDPGQSIWTTTSTWLVCGMRSIGCA